ncbi:MAG: O-antigen ligase family protein, partial [Kiritimatiellae bacterium]|nr:O-antigen ligase family protein [Kiritimatiellia bacterium]
EAKAWALAGPDAAFLPGSVEGAGALPAATAVAATVLMQSCRHALGKSARVCFLFAGAFLAGVAAFSAAVACACGHARALALAACPIEDATYAGTAFGLHFMGSMVATACSFERKWQKVMPLLAIGISGCAVGLYLFAPEVTIMACAAGAVLVLLSGLAYAYVRVGVLSVPKILAFLIVVAIIPTLFIAGVVPDAIKDLRFAGLVESGRVFADRLVESRAVLSGIAAKVWKESPWLGTGVGSFALDIGFNATEADWAAIASRQATALNGWWQMLAERGIVGTLLFAVPVLFLVWTYLARLSALVAQAVRRRRLSVVLPVHPCCVVGPLAVALVVACGFCDCAFMRPETSLAAASMFAMAGSAFPAVREKAGDEAETEK